MNLEEEMQAKWEEKKRELEEECAWHYCYHDKTPAYAEAEKDARKNRRGLWVSDSPVNPYQWRKSKRIM